MRFSNALRDRASFLCQVGVAAFDGLKGIADATNPYAFLITVIGAPIGIWQLADPRWALITLGVILLALLIEGAFRVAQSHSHAETGARQNIEQVRAQLERLGSDAERLRRRFRDHRAVLEVWSEVVRHENELFGRQSRQEDEFPVRYSLNSYISIAVNGLLATVDARKAAEFSTFRPLEEDAAGPLRANLCKTPSTTRRCISGTGPQNSWQMRTALRQAAERAWSADDVRTGRPNPWPRMRGA